MQFIYAHTALSYEVELEHSHVNFSSLAIKLVNLFFYK